MTDNEMSRRQADELTGGSMSELMEKDGDKRPDEEANQTRQNRYRRNEKRIVTHES